MNTSLPTDLREFDDADKTRQLIYDNALSSLGKRFPIEDDEYRLELHKPHYDGSQDYSLKQQKDALLKDRQLRTPIVGTWKLIHKPTNTVLDEREDTVMHIPYYTPRGTFIQGGNEISIANQSRLKAGAYVRKRRTGEIETHINVIPGTGKTFRLNLEPETGIFRVNVGQSNIPVYPLLKTLGVDDKTLEKAWGKDLLITNMTKKDVRALPKLYKNFSGYAYDPKADETQMADYLKTSLPAARVDPGVISRTMGLEKVEGVSPELLVRATNKMLNVWKGNETADDRDAPMYSNIHSVEDLIQERIDKDAGHIARTLLWKARRARNLQPVRRAALNPYISSLLMGSGLAQPLEETNVLSTLEQQNRITKLGEGGISSAESVTDEARNVNNGQLGFIDSISGPESGNVGIDVRAAYGTYKGKDKQLYGEFKDVRTGKTIYANPETIHTKVLAFPGEMAKKQDTAMAMVGGKIKRVPKADVDLEVPSINHMFSGNMNLIPMFTSAQAGRMFYGSKFWTQYLPLVKGEVPLVDNLMPDGKMTFSEHYGRRVGSMLAKTGGVVTRIDADGITIKDDNGKPHRVELIKDLPFNRISSISYFPSVKTGDRVNVGDMVAHSNFTDAKTGSLTLGVNLKTAISTARGNSYEDAQVISEAASKKLATERLIGFDQEATHGIDLSRNKYVSLFPNQFTKQQFETIDDTGVVKPGTIVNKGDPIILAVGPKLLTSADAQLGKLHKTLRDAHVDKATVWDSAFPGVVVDAVQTPSGAKVNVKSTPPVQVGDKLSGCYGLKGIVGAILPQDKMPRDSVTNEPYEVLLNPMGILSRVAPAQIASLQLAKIAKKTGKQIRIPTQPPEEGWAEWTKKQLAANGLKEDNDLFDPETGKTIKGVSDGHMYLSAFHHLAEKKLSERGEEGSYTVDEQAAKGGETGQAKRFGSMDVNQTLAHGAYEVLKDALVIRGSKNEEYFKALKLGRPLPEPKVPFIYDKFLNTLKAGGINIADKGDTLSLLPMTDKDVDVLARGSISNSRMIDKDFEPEPGGLFDVGKTGGMAGNKWSSVLLNEPMPNPVMEEPIRRVLGLTVAQMRDVLSGKESINGISGGRGLQQALTGIDIDAELAKQTERAKTLRGTNRDSAVKVIGYLSAAKKQGVHPSNWVITKVPVLPPKFRPIARMGDMPLVADLNQLYADLIEQNNNIKDLRKDLPETELEDEKLSLYDAVTAAYGLGEPITSEGQSKRLKGAIRQVIGQSPKHGLAQSKLFSKQVSGVGRAVVVPDPNLDMDHIGIPEDSAWTMYKDFVRRRLVRRGYPVIKATEMIDKRDPTAREMLEDEMQSRPVIVDRAPTWHKFNLLAFYPHMVEGHVIRASPLITRGYNLDFDGDMMNFHVPVSEKASDEAKEKMLPSKNLFSLTDLQSARHTPTMEMTLGLFQMTKDPNKKPVQRFANIQEARKAYARGEIKMNDPIEVKGT